MIRLTYRAVTNDRQRLRRQLRLGGLTIVGASIAWVWLVPTAASAATVRVCPRGCAYSQLADAAAVAHDGDRLSVADGTYRGGFAITKSLTIDGAGAGRTTIKGGGPVITVGTLGGS